ncbi:MAG: phosphoribosylamine--glycine ligase [SAR86 cluster bacterium]|nr:phosphoribosylamine--glycine ligase [SAR86 cluster bacterium]
MKVLIVGSGGREHALAWKIAKSNIVTEVFVAPGNGGTAMEDSLINIDIQSNDIDSLSKFALKNNINLTIIGPEEPLVNGITDKFNSMNLNCFGPTRAASQLEGSKEYMKEFLQRHNIPTADYKSFVDPENAIKYIKEKGCPIVIKADGLAAGKGVTVALNEQEAIHAINECLVSNVFGNAGSKVVIEEFLTGEEASFIVLTDGNLIIPFASSQDHKARDDNDLGPNTGGMGAYSPAPVVTDIIHGKILEQIIEPTIYGLNKDNTTYCGFLYAGVMIDKENNLKVLEFNCRFGDPETQPIMMRLDSDLAKVCYEATTGNLKQQSLKWKPGVALGVVMASGGYPNSYKKGSVINGIPVENKKMKVFHAGTKLVNDELLSSGGRVLCVTALGDNTLEAQERAYASAKIITWEDCFYRSDIGYRAIERGK